MFVTINLKCFIKHNFDYLKVSQEENTVLLNQEIQDEIDILKEQEEIIKDRNIPFLTGNNGQNVCLVTVAMDDNSAINSEIGIDTFLIHNIKKDE